jgi:uncharacterized SAM-binding protein YcdF (DUF218 family)
MTRRRAIAGVLIALASLTALAVLCHRPILKLIGAALVVEDRLERADAIVVVAGGTPTREAKAAALFRGGWAPRLIVSQPVAPSSVRELTTLGVRPLDLQGESMLVLERYGVPRDRIVTVPEPSTNTESELNLVHELARGRGYRRVILVTSPQHTRRVHVIWSRASTDDHIEGLVVPAQSGDFSVDGWWRKRGPAEAVLHEYLGILAIYLGISHLMR